MSVVKKLKVNQESGFSSSEPTSEKTYTKTVNAGKEKKSLSFIKHKPSVDLFAYPQVIYGERKIGKTSLVSMYGSEKKDSNIYAFMFEENRSYSLYMSEITEWQDFLDVIPDFIAGKHNFQACWIDNARNAYDMALAYACKKFGFEHPGRQNDHGDSWNKVYLEFCSPIRQLLTSKYAMMVTCHELEKEIETRSGRKFLKMSPDLTNQASRLITGELYNVFYYHYVRDERFLQIQGDEYITAGHRMEGHFLTTEGETVFKVPMGKSKEEAYENLMQAFNNQQRETYKDAVEPKVGEHLKKKKVKKESE